MSGNARAILAGERAALNFIGHLSGVATATAALVAKVAGTKTRVTCTRKTTPGLRALQKYAVRCGGGFNHRFGLDDAILIKDNHIAVAGGIRPALERAKSVAGHLVKIEIEVDTLEQLREVLDCGLADVVLLDNMDIVKLKQAVDLVAGRLVIEASGGIMLDNAGAIARDWSRLHVVRRDHAFGAQSRYRARHRDLTAAAYRALCPASGSRRSEHMSLSMYQASVPVFVRGLGILSTLLEKAVAHAKDKGIEPGILINARLASDMLPLAGQIQRASDTSKLAIERLTGIQSPRFEDNESTFDALQDRISRTIAFLQGIDAGQMQGAQERTVQLNFGTFKPSFKGDQYLLTFALPNFFFHITTAYDILRHQGLSIGKLDYLGSYDRS